MTSPLSDQQIFLIHIWNVHSIGRVGRFSRCKEFYQTSKLELAKIYLDLLWNSGELYDYLSS